MGGGFNMQESKVFARDPVAAEESEMQGSKTMIDCAPVAAEESEPESNLLYRACEEFERGKRKELTTDEGKDKSWRKRCLVFSQVAIAYFNANNPEAEIELMEEGSPRFVFHQSTMWYHFNFKARPKNSDSPNPPSKLYFAEILPQGKENHVTTVCVVDPHDSESTINGCEYCRPNPIKYRIYHPKDGKWTAGRLMQSISLTPYSGWGGFNMQQSKVFACDPVAAKESEMQRSKTGIDCATIAAEESKPGSSLLHRASEEFERSKVCLFPDDRSYGERRNLNPMTDESWQRRSVLFSVAAITYYNANNQDAKIELMEEGSPRVVFHQHAMWYHFNFKARPKNSDSPDPPSKLYFAEILPRGKEIHVTTVCVVDPHDFESIIDCCEYCTPYPIEYRIYHPKDGNWTAGRLMQPISLTPYSGWGGGGMQESRVFARHPVATKESEMQESKTVIDCATVAVEESKPGSSRRESS